MSKIIELYRGLTKDNRKQVKYECENNGINSYLFYEILNGDKNPTEKFLEIIDNVVNMQLIENNRINEKIDGIKKLLTKD